jgi:hypothetical protein
MNDELERMWKEVILASFSVPQPVWRHKVSGVAQFVREIVYSYVVVGTRHYIVIRN